MQITQKIKFLPTIEKWNVCQFLRQSAVKFSSLQQKPWKRKHTLWISWEFYSSIYKNTQKSKNTWKKGPKLWKLSQNLIYLSFVSSHKMVIKSYTSEYATRQLLPGIQRHELQSWGWIHNTGQCTHLYADEEAVKATQLSDFGLIRIFRSVYCP